MSEMDLMLELEDCRRALRRIVVLCGGPDSIPPGGPWEVVAWVREELAKARAQQPPSRIEKVAKALFNDSHAGPWELSSFRDEYLRRARVLDEAGLLAGDDE